MAINRDYELLEDCIRTLKLCRIVEGLEGQEEMRGVTSEDINSFLRNRTPNPSVHCNDVAIDLITEAVACLNNEQPDQAKVILNNLLNIISKQDFNLATHKDLNELDQKFNGLSIRVKGLESALIGSTNMLKDILNSKKVEDPYVLSLRILNNLTLINA